MTQQSPSPQEKRNLLQQLRNWLMDGDTAATQMPCGDLAADAQLAAGLQQAHGARLLVWIALAAIIVLLLWASLGHIDEVVRGQGKVVPSRQVQVVQSLDGGIVEEILVRPGQQVEEGQVLLRLDPTRFSSSLGENRAEALALKAKAARLQALATGELFQIPEDVMQQAPTWWKWSARYGRPRRTSWTTRSTSRATSSTSASRSCARPWPTATRPPPAAA